MNKRSNTNLFKTIATSLLATSLIACQTAQPTKQTAPPVPATMRDVTWVAALVRQPELDANRQCVRSSLQTAFALLAFRDGGFDDQYIQSALLNNLPNEKVRALRKADLAEWLRTHEPALVAETHLKMCLADNGNALPASDAWVQCFLSSEPAAVLSIYRRTGRSLSAAVQAVTPYYPINANGSDIAELGRQVYVLQTDADDQRFREDLFTDCLAVVAE